MKENHKIKALNFFCSQIIVIHVFINRSEQDNSFLKHKFFKNVLAEILKINGFSSVAKTKIFKAEISFVTIHQIALTLIKFLIFNIQLIYWYDCEHSKDNSIHY